MLEKYKYIIQNYFDPQITGFYYRIAKMMSLSLILVLNYI